MGKGTTALGTSLWTLAALHAWTAASAQMPLPSTTGVAGSTSEPQAESAEIIVTAQRRAERLQDVPISITALSGDTLVKAGAQRLDDIAKLTPGLSFNHTGGFTLPTIRGVGTSIVGAGTGNNVGLYVDGFFLPNPLATDMQLLNVSSIQVLKGPQGTLFGRNTTGGAILVQTSDPSLTTAARGEISYGRFDAKSAQGYLTTALDDHTAVDFAGVYRQGDGFVRNIVSGRKGNRYENWSIRTGLKANLSDTFSALVRYSHSSFDDPTSQTTGAYCCNAQSVAYSIAPYIGGQTATAPDIRITDIDPIFTVKTDVAQLTLNLDLDFANLKSYSQYRSELGTTTTDLETSSLPLANYRFPYRDKILTQELILSSSGPSKLQWTVGGFYFRDKSTSSLDVSVGGAPFTNQVIRTIVTVESYAGYADATYRLGDKLYLTGGVRVSHDNYIDPHNLIGPDPNPFRLQHDPISSTRVTPRAVIRYEFDPRTSVYGSFNQGYKSAIRNIAGASNALVTPEKINAYELGFKHAGRRISFNAAAYYYDYKNLQVSSYRGPVAITNNAANSRIYGAEGDFTYLVDNHFQMSGGVAYTNAKYKSYPGAPIYIQCLNPVTCGADYGTFPTMTANLKNSPMQFAPKFKGQLSGQYRTGLAGGIFLASGTIAYQTRQFFDASALFHDVAHENLTLRVQWTDPSDRYTIAFYGDNITDKRYYVQIIPQVLAIPVSYNSPATWGVSFGFKL